MMQNGIAFCGWFIFFVAMEHHGERPLAITNVVRSISSFLFMFVNAFASTNSSLVSNLIGAGQTEKVMPLCRQMIRLCYSFVLPLALLMAIFPTVVLRLRLEMMSIFIYILYIIWIVVVRKADVAACWTTEHVYDLMVLTSYFYLLKGNWRNKRI